MAGPWETYQATDEKKPWEKYAATPPAESNKIPRTIPDQLTGAIGQAITRGTLPPDLSQAVGSGVVNFVPNLAKTAYGMGKNLVYEPIAQSIEQKSPKPIAQTAGNVALTPGALPVGFAEKMIEKYGGEQGGKFLDWFGRGALDKFWQPFENQLKEKYGSYGDFKKTIAERPAEALLDLSMILGVGGKTLKNLDVEPYSGKMGNTAYRDLKDVNKGNVLSALRPYNTGPLTKLGNAMEQLSGGVNPIALVTGSVGAAINPLRDKLYQQGIKTRQLGESKGIPTTLGEDIGSPTLQRAETLAERVPGVGLSGFRTKQLAAADNAAKEFLGKYIANPENATMEGNRAFTSGLYEDMKRTVGPVKDLPVYAKETSAQAKELLTRYPDMFKAFQDTKREALINKVKEQTTYRAGEVGAQEAPNIAAKGVPAKGPAEIEPFNKLSYTINKLGSESAGIKPNAARGVPVPTNQITFDDMWALRDGLGDMIGQAKKKLQAGAVDRTAISQLNSLYKAVNNDIDSWAKSVGKPQIRESINAANDAYKRYVVKYDLVQKAYDKAAGVSSARELFSPKTFSTELKKMIYKDKQYKSFSAGEVEEMTGLANIMQVVKRAGAFAENPPTGNRMIEATMTGGGIAGLITNPITTLKVAAAVGGTTATLRFLTTTKMGKNLLMRASKTEPTSPAMGQIMNLIYQANQVTEGQNKPQMKSYAEGGDIEEGDEEEPILVGEKGPEVIIPNTSGTVIPNKALQIKPQNYKQRLNFGKEDEGGGSSEKLMDLLLNLNDIYQKIPVNELGKDNSYKGLMPQQLEDEQGMLWSPPTTRDKNRALMASMANYMSPDAEKRFALQFLLPTENITPGVMGTWRF